MAKWQVSDKAGIWTKACLTAEPKPFFTTWCHLPGIGRGLKLGSFAPLRAQLTWDGWDLLAQQGEWDAVWVAGAFCHDHSGDTTLGISFNLDSSQEVQGNVQVDCLPNQRPADNKIHSEKRTRRPFTPSTLFLHLCGHYSGYLWRMSSLSTFFMRYNIFALGLLLLVSKVWFLWKFYIAAH